MSLKSFALGIVDGLVETFEAVVDIAKNPKGTIDAVKDAVTNPGETTKAIIESAKNTYTNFQNADADKKDYLLGKGAVGLIGGSKATNSVIGKVNKNKKNKVNLYIKPKSNWTSEQKKEANLKAKKLTKSKTIVTHGNHKRNSKLAKDFRNKIAKNTLNKDVDHIVDLQLGGKDNSKNMMLLDKSVNRSFGAQIHNQIKKLPNGTVINKVIIKNK